MFRSACGKVLSIGSLLFLCLLLAMGVASAGTVDLGCGCTPDTSATDCLGNTYKWCRCGDSQGLSAWATNEYNRGCDGGNTSYDPNSVCNSAPPVLVDDLPSNVTCTVPVAGLVAVTNDCTNWNFGTRHFTVLTYCAHPAPLGPTPP